MKDYVLINNSDKLFVIKFSRIIKITSNGNCCDIEDAEGSRCSVSKCLSKVYSELPPTQFIKVSQSCIINVQYLKVVDKKNKIIYLTNGEEIKYSIAIRDLIKYLII